MKRFFLGILGIVLLTSSVYAENTNIIQNGDFEKGKAGWSFKGIGRIVDNSKGGKCAKIDKGFLLSSKFPVQGGKHYRFSMDIKGNKLTEFGGFPQLSFRGPRIRGWSGPVSKPFPGTKRKPERVLFAKGGTFDWQNISLIVKAPRNAKNFFIYLRKDGDKGSVYYDNIKCEETSDPLTPAAKLRKAGLAPEKPFFEDDDFCTEKLLNNNFSNDMEHWTVNGISKIDKTGSSAENKCIKITHGDVLQGVKIKPKTNYRITTKVKTDNCNDDSVFVKTSYRGELIRRTRPEGVMSTGDKRQTPVVIVTGGTHDWQEFSTVVTSNKHGDSVLISLGKLNDEGTAWFDDFKIEETAEKPITPESIKAKHIQTLFPAAPAGQDNNKLIDGALKLMSEKTDKLNIVKDGKTSYKIYSSKADFPIEFHAAEEMAKYLTKISKVNFTPFAYDDNPASIPLLIIGRNNKLINKLIPEIEYDKLGDDGFIIKTAGPHLIIAGNKPRGTLYGVYYFLDRILGVRWLSPHFTKIPNNAEISIQAINQTHIPRFDHRQIFADDTAGERYRAHNLLNGKTHHWTSYKSPAGINSWTCLGLDSGHNVQKIVSKKKYAKSHPEYFTGGQLAFMNEEVRKVATQALIEKLKKTDYKNNYFQIGQMDHGWSPDADCKAFIDAHGGAWSAPILDFIKDVGSRVRKELPGAKFCQSAYQWSFKPPENMTIPDWMMVCVAPIKSNYTYPLQAPENNPIKSDIEGWARLTTKITIWDYLTNFGSYIQPHPNLYQLGESVKWLATIPQMKGYFGQSSYSGNYAEFAELRTWVMSRLLWDPSLDTKALIKEFLQAYYGDAAPFIEEYIEMMQKEVVETKSKLQTRTAVAQPYLSFKNMHKADQLMDQAENAVKNNPVFLRHVQKVRIGIDYVILLRRAVFAREAKKAGIDWDPEVEKRIKRFSEMMELGNVKSLGEGVGKPDKLIQAMKIEKIVSPDPEICKELPVSDWVDFQELSLRQYAGDLVADPLASDHGALRMIGKSPVWGIQMKMDNLPQKGFWKLYVVVRVDPGNGTPEDNAIHFGVHPGFTRNVKLAEVADGKYHIFECPGEYENEFGKGLWFSPPNSNAVKYIYVDRVIAIRKDQ